MSAKTGLALSIQQPWAWLIVHGYKDVENRSWATRLRGTVGVHAGKKIDTDAIEDIRDLYPDVPLPDSFETGGIVGRVEIVDCVEAMESRWFYGPYGFVLQNGSPLPLMPCRGKLGFFKPDIAGGQ